MTDDGYAYSSRAFSLCISISTSTQDAFVMGVLCLCACLCLCHSENQALDSVCKLVSTYDQVQLIRHSIFIFKEGRIAFLRA